MRKKPCLNTISSRARLLNRWRLMGGALANVAEPRRNKTMKIRVRRNKLSRSHGRSACVMDKERGLLCRWQDQDFEPACWDCNREGFSTSPQLSLAMFSYKMGIALNPQAVPPLPQSADVYSSCAPPSGLRAAYDLNVVPPRSGWLHTVGM